VPVPAPTLALGADRIAYATLGGTRGTPVTITAYDRAGAVLYTAQPIAAFGIAFDASGVLWLDRGEFATYLPDGTAGPVPRVLSGGGSLGAFDLKGTMYTQGATAVSVLRLAGPGYTIVDTLPTTPEPCWTAADGAGRVYVAPCTAGPTPYVRTLGAVSMYSLVTNAPLATNPNATGPVAVDTAGNFYAVYNGAVGVWNAGAFGAAPPGRTLPPGPPGTITSIAVDRGGTAYVIVHPTGTTYTTPSTLYAVAPGATTAVIVQTGFVGQVATSPQ
jgi:hypothetical protein